MKNNDLSSSVTPRILLVAEGALIYSVNTKAKRFRQQWALYDLMVRRILWLFHQKDVRIEIVTYLGDEIAEQLAEWLDDEMVPVSRVWSTSPESLARGIAYMPDLALVYDAEAERWLTYGAKGRYLTDVGQFGEF
jgi:hypothetical protein